MTEMFTAYTDERGHQHEPCALCGADCSTHPDAGNPLASCGDCGRATCPDHRVDDAAQRCNDCAAQHYAKDATIFNAVKSVQRDTDGGRCRYCGDARAAGYSVTCGKSECQEAAYNDKERRAPRRRTRKAVR